jgi:selenocysteine lyase/cysteine desulfurase
MIECQKSAFDLPVGEHYLNGAYMAPMSRAVATVGHASLERLSAPGALGPADFFEEATHVRSLFARLVGAREPDRIAIIPAVSYGLAVVARNVRLGPRQNVVVAEEQFPSNIYSWRRLCAAAGAELRAVTAPETGAERGAVWYRPILEAIGTGLVALPHLHWTDGTRYDLATIGRRARDCDACFVVDGTQSVGATPFDLETVPPDGACACRCGALRVAPYLYNDQTDFDALVDVVGTAIAGPTTDQ